MSKSDMAQSTGKSKAQSEVRDSDLWYKRYPRVFREATSRMPFELRAAYGLVIDFYYEHGGPLPDDDKWIACALFIDVRKWKPIRSGLFKHGKLYVGPDHMIHNDTADAMLAERTASLEASSEAQKRKRSKRDVPENLPRNLGTTSVGTEGDFSEKPNEISEGVRQSKIKKKTVEEDTPTTNVIHLGKEIASRARTAPDAIGPDAASVLADEGMIFDLMNWSGDDRVTSIRWLQDFLAQYGESAVRASYTKLKRDIRDGLAGVRKPVISPMGVWPIIAERKYQDRLRRDPNRHVAAAKEDFKKKHLKPRA